MVHHVLPRGSGVRGSMPCMGSRGIPRNTCGMSEESQVKLPPDAGHVKATHLPHLNEATKPIFVV